MAFPPKRHLYQQIADEIRGAIGRGAYGADGRLPSERQLVHAFATQRKTVRQALTLLAQEGRIESVGKSGWYVAQIGNETASAAKRVLLVTFRRGELPSTDAILRGLTKALGTESLPILRHDSTGHREADHLATVEELMSLRASGVVMWPHGSIESELLGRLQAESPIVLIDRRVFGLLADSVRFDDQGGGRLVTEHLLANGHRRIAFFGDEPFAESVQARWTGYRRALEDAGIEPDDRLSMMTFGFHEPALTTNLRLLVRGLPDPPTAVVCSNDGVATRLLLFLRQEGLRVPDDLAVTGFGNGSPDTLDLLGLTTVAQSFEEMGQIAGELLLARIREPFALHGRPPQEVLLPMRLVVRTSGGPPKRP